MIKIIERHEPKCTYQWQCKGCNSIFQFDKTDCNESYDRNSRILEIICPVCGRPSYSWDPWKPVRTD